MDSIERKKWIETCLRKADLDTAETIENLCSFVFATIEVWKFEQIDIASFRKDHDQLRALWKLINDSDPAISQIRGRIRVLPARSRSYLMRRASGIWFNAMLRQKRCDLTEWANSAPAPRLIYRLRMAISEGGIIVPGRNRASGKQSAKRLEPIIMGIARGSNYNSTAGGRPNGADEERLVSYLAVDWALATGKLPERGRSSETAFGELVHHVFSWTTKSEPDQALRRYWDAFEQRSKKAK